MISANDKLTLIKHVDIFKHLSEKYLLDIVHVLDEAYFEAGESIIKKGEKGDCMYIIFEGEVKVHDGEVVFARLAERDFFGELSVLSPEPRIASVSAIDDTGALKLNRESFFSIVGYNIEVYQAIIHALAQRLRDMNEAIKRLPMMNKL